MSLLCLKNELSVFKHLTTTWKAQGTMPHTVAKPNSKHVLGHSGDWASEEVGETINRFYESRRLIIVSDCDSV